MARDRRDSVRYTAAPRTLHMPGADMLLLPQVSQFFWTTVWLTAAPSTYHAPPCPTHTLLKSPCHELLPAAPLPAHEHMLFIMSLHSVSKGPSDTQPEFD